MTLAVGRHCLDLSRKGRGNILLVGMEDDIEEMRKSSKQELFRRMSSKNNFEKLVYVCTFYVERLELSLDPGVK